MSSLDDAKIPIPQYIAILIKDGVPAKTAMPIVGKIYKNHNTRSKLATLTVSSPAFEGIAKEEAKRTLTAFSKAGYIPAVDETRSANRSGKRKSTANGNNDAPGPSSSRTASAISPKKRRRTSDRKNEFLPDEEEDEYESLEWNETTDEKTLAGKKCTINRAPLLMAWSSVVAERIGFQREEALSIASVLTEINAVSKGISLGIYSENRLDKATPKDESQPYLDLMGRRPLFKTKSSHWRALSENIPQSPGRAFSYISRAFQEATPYVMGALQLLAASYESQKINDKAWSLYCEFRPAMDIHVLGGRAEVHCDKILGLRKIPVTTSKLKATGDTLETNKNLEKQPTLEEYEDMLEQDHTFDALFFAE